MADDKTIEIIKRKLREWKGQTIKKDMLIELRIAINKKNAPFSNVRKWISATRKQMAAEEKASKKATSAPGAPSNVALRSTMPVPLPPAPSERVYLQNIGYEIAGIRRALEKMTQQLDVVEKQLAAVKSQK